MKKEISDIKYHKKKAFSLLENMIVITIIGLILLIAVPNVVNQREIKQNKVFVTKSVNLYYNILNKYMARSTAIKRTSSLNSKILGNNCERIRRELNVHDIQADSSCIFATPDGIKWNFALDGRPGAVIIGLKKATFQDLTITEALKRSNINVFLISYRVQCNAENDDCRVQILVPDSSITNLQQYQLATEKTRRFIHNENLRQNIDAGQGWGD